MNICIVNTYSHGGAAVAALRQIEALGNQGDSVTFVTKEDVHKGSEEYVFVKGLSGVSIDRESISRVVRRLDFIERQRIKNARSARTNTLFSGSVPDYDLSEIEAVSKADVVNLHWVSHFLNSRSVNLLISSGKPVVWTLHDQRTFSGGCHYMAGCEQFEKICEDCPQVIGSEKSKVLRNHQDAISDLRKVPIVFACPSRWLADTFRKSAVFNAELHRVMVIPNSISTDCFAPCADKEERRSLRSLLGIPPDAFSFVAGCVSWDEERKGGRFLYEALVQFAALQSSGVRDVVLITYGNQGLDPIPGLEIIHLGNIPSEKAMADLLRCGDIYLTMTREDNLPNTILESLASGLPVFSTEVGGVPEMVADNVNGRLIPKDDSEAMCRLMLEAVSSDKVDEWSRNARSRAVSEYSFHVQAARYKEAYEESIQQFEEWKSSKGFISEERGDPTYVRVVEDLLGGMAVLDEMYEKSESARVNARSELRSLRGSRVYRVVEAVLRPLRLLRGIVFGEEGGERKV